MPFLFFVVLVALREAKASIPATTTSCHFDCNKGLHNWQSAWGQTKKEYCCKHAGVGCGTQTTPCHYDCTVGFVNWKMGWAQSKKDFCCRNHGVACNGVTTTRCEYHCNVG